MKTILIGLAIAAAFALVLSVIYPCICPYKSSWACALYCS